MNLLGITEADAYKFIFLGEVEDTVARSIKYENKLFLDLESPFDTSIRELEKLRYLYEIEDFYWL